MKFKEYEMPDGKKAAFEYDENGVGKITLECMDMLMGLINDRKTEPQTEYRRVGQAIDSVTGKVLGETYDVPRTDCSWKKGE